MTKKRTRPNTAIAPVILMAAVTLSACAQDKQKHFVAGTAGADAVTAATGDWKKGCLAALGLGIGKEVYDSMGNGTVDAMDAVATTAGCAVWSVEF